MLDERLYRSLYRIRRVEEEIARVYPSDKIQSPVHLAIGQEFISVAVCEALERGDVAFGTYRSHAYYLAKGGDLRGMIAELYGKATGVAKGKAGSMHLIDVSAGVMGASAVVASSISQAVGYALAVQMRREPRVVVCFFGEGAVEEGTFHESLNFASLKRLPILFVCENNGYAIHSRQRDRQAGQICDLAAAHGIAAERFADQDIYRLYARSCQVVEQLRGAVRSKELQLLGSARDTEVPHYEREEFCGPVLFECLCYRWREHVGPGEDFDAGYRHRDESARWLATDPLALVGSRLGTHCREQLEAEVEAEIRDAFEFAEQSPFPADDELYTDLFA
jgi:TPP-dependent pyruvate/acetoin dehydrogenase alpha subunit